MTREMFGIGSRISHAIHGKGVVIGVRPMDYQVVFMDKGEVLIRKDDGQITVIERIEPDQDMVSLHDIEQVFTGILRRWSDVTEIVPIHDHWKRGTFILQPFDRSMASKEVPIDAFFHKIVMLRDRLRVLEQRINAHKVLDDEDKVNIQQYITRIYGTLTTFNVLFRDKEDHFVGEKGSDKD